MYVVKWPLGTEVGFIPGHIVLDGDPAPPPSKGAQAQKGTGPQSLANICSGRIV